MRLSPSFKQFPQNVASEKLHIPKAKTELFKKTFTYSGPKLWNELPFSIRQASSHNAEVQMVLWDLDLISILLFFFAI
jgi:hypothetical protein